MRVAWGRAAREVGQTLNQASADALAKTLLARMSGQMNDTTGDAVMSILADGIRDGATISDMQARIIDAAAFAPSRALAVARTETTRATSSAASSAWQSVSDSEGITIRRRWLAARDGSTREAHRALDGQVVALGQSFVVPAGGGEFAGTKGAGPGEFSSAGMCVNCRCTVVPVVE